MPGTVLLLVGGDPALKERRDGTPANLSMGARIFLPANLAAKRPGPPPGAEDEAWPLPPAQLMGAQQLLDATKRQGRTVKVVDVNRPGDDLGLVQRFFGVEDPLPIAVRSDGVRLVGAETFTPKALRDFLRGA